MSRSLLSPTRLAWLAVIAALSAALPAPAQAHLKSSPGVIAAFKNVVAKPSESTVRVLCDGTDSALGTIVAPDGWVITKASELKGKVVCRLKDGRSFDARIVGVEPKYDLAMLKIAASGLKPIEWRDAKTTEVGSWVASPGNGNEPVAVGIVSVATRKPGRRDLPMNSPPTNGGYLGVGLEDGDGAPKIGLVAPRSAADKAGLKVGDVVLAVSGRAVASAERLVEAIQRFRPGQEVVLKVKRGEEVKELKAKLEKRPATPFNRGDFQNRMGSTLSNRRGGFPVILQHDTVIKPTDCGGPLVDLDGKALGINIARAGRTESYAIPAEAVLALVNDLKSGKLAPKVEPDGPAISKLEKAVEATRADLQRAQEALKAVDAERKNVAVKKKAIEKQLEALRKKLAEAQDALDKARKDGTKK